VSDDSFVAGGEFFILDQLCAFLMTLYKEKVGTE
jgi:hypothetical protein